MGRYQDYDAFGALLPGRNFSSDAYRFGFNGQEKVDEVNGSTGTHNTALFWEYDTRTGRRWNLDPKPVAWESQYAANGDNPIFYKDPNGDFKSKFGASVYKFFNGGEIRRATGGDRAGEWFVGKDVKVEPKEHSSQKRADGTVELSEHEVAYERKFGWGGGIAHPGNGVDRVAGLAKGVWDSPPVRALTGDAIFLTLTGEFVTHKGGAQAQYGRFMPLHGEDAWEVHSMTSVNGAIGLGVGGGAQWGVMHFLGPADKFKAQDVGGPQLGFNVGLNAGVASVGLGVEYSPAIFGSQYSMLTRSASVGIGPELKINGSDHVEGFSFSVGNTFVDR